MGWHVRDVTASLLTVQLTDESGAETFGETQWLLCHLLVELADLLYATQFPRAVLSDSVSVLPGTCRSTCSISASGRITVTFMGVPG